MNESVCVFFYMLCEETRHTDERCNFS